MNMFVPLVVSLGACGTSAPLMESPFFSGLAGTTRDFWAVGDGIWHVVDGKVVEKE